MATSLPDKIAYFFKRKWNIPPKVRRVIAISLTLLAVVILGRMIYTNWKSLQDFQWKVRPVALIGSFLAYIFYIGIAAFSYGSILNSLGSTSSWRQHFRVYYISTLANRLPIPIGYIAGRLFLYNESTTRKTISFASGIELLFVGMADVSLGAIFKPKSFTYFNWWVYLPVLLAGLIIVHPRILGPLLAFLKFRDPFELRYWQSIKWLLSYLLVMITGGLALYLLIISFYPLPFIYLPNIVGAWCLASLVGILIAFLPLGLGIHEVTLSLLLSSFLPPAISAIIAILSRIVFTIFEIAMAGIASALKE